MTVCPRRGEATTVDGRGADACVDVTAATAAAMEGAAATGAAGRTAAP